MGCLGLEQSTSRTVLEQDRIAAPRAKDVMVCAGGSLEARMPMGGTRLRARSVALHALQEETGSCPLISPFGVHCLEKLGDTLLKNGANQSRAGQNIA